MKDGIPSPESGALIFEAQMKLDRLASIGKTPFGNRRVAVGLEGKVTGPKLSGTVMTGALEFELTLANGAVEVEDIFVFKTDDSKYLGAAAALQTVSIADVAVTEGAANTTKTVTLTVTRSSSVGTLAMNWVLEPALGGATATNGTDYTGATSGVVTFAPGQTTATITFTVKGDATVEPNESFVVRLQPNAAANLQRSGGVATIVNDD